jgi:hypothetical protein
MKWTTLRGRTLNLNEKKFDILWFGKSASMFQRNIKMFFFPYWEKDLVGEEVTLPNTKLRVDIINFTRKIAIECNGKFHKEYTSYLHKNLSDFKRQVSRDVLKEHLLEINGFRVIEIYEKNMPLTEEWILETFGDILF